MLIKSFVGGCHKSYVTDCDNVEDVSNFIKSKELIPGYVRLRFESNGRVLSSNSKLDSTLHTSVSVTLDGGLPGGKGGFGSLLRSIGAQIEKTTNHEAMRDLSGRRQRDVNNEERLKKYVAGAAEREREAREKKEEKLEKLRRLADGENQDKRGFSDPFYDKVRSETEEKVHDAIEAAQAALATTSNNNLKRKSEAVKEVETPVVKKKAKGLWIGEGLDDLDDSDLTDSDDESKVGEEKEKR